MKVKVGNKEVDLAPLMPLRAGDFRRVEKSGVSMREVENGSFEGAFQLVLAVLRRADEKIVESQLDDIPVSEISRIGQFLKKHAVQDTDERPTSASPTSSSTHTDGASPS